MIQHLQTVHRSYLLLLPHIEQAVTGFYARLFELDPTLRPLFTSNPGLQSQKFTQMLDTLLGDPERFEALLPAVRRMGLRHLEYGAQEAHYATVGAALLYALEGTLGQAFTPEVREAWIAVYGLLTKVMLEATHSEPQP